MDTSWVPRYQRVVEHIKNQIRGGTYRIGEILPGERVLAATLAISRPSVKRAINALE